MTAPSCITFNVNTNILFKQTQTNNKQTTEKQQTNKQQQQQKNRKK